MSLSKSLRTNLIIIVIITVSVGTIASAIVAKNNWTFLYSDTRTHLIIARRVFDSITPGIAQLGGTWLPLQHISMFPTIWIDSLWRTPLSSYIPNILFLSIFTSSIYLLTWKKTKSVPLSFLLAIAPLTNTNLLYMQALPMFEMLFLTLLGLILLFSYLWNQEKKIPILILLGLSFMLASLTRYEGWPLALSGVLAIILTGLITKLPKKKIEGQVLIYAMIAMFGIFLWLLWQLLIFRDPLYFLHSPYSSENNTMEAIASGKAITYKNLKIAVLSMVLASVYNNGIVSNLALPIVFTLGLFQAFKKKNIKTFAVKFLWIGVIFTPIIFDIYATYSGKVSLYVPELTKSNFNIRFGLYALPALLGSIVIFSSSRKIITLFAILIISCNLMTNSVNLPITLKAAQVESSNKVKEAAIWLATNYEGGKIMISGTNSGMAMMFYSNMPLSNFITDANGEQWESALKFPYKYARWLVASKTIAEKNREFITLNIVLSEKINHYDQEFENDIFVIYKLNY